MKVTDFLHAGTNFCMFKDVWKFWGWRWPKMIVSKIYCIWRINRWSKLNFCMLIQIHKNSKMIKCFMCRHGQKLVLPVWSWDSKMTISQKWTNGINWFFVCWYKLEKAESWFNDFWVGMVKNNHDLLVHEILKSDAS